MSERSTELYAPRKCSATNRIISATDHASVQLNVGHVDAQGVYTGSFSAISLSGFIRGMAESDAAVNRLAAEQNLMRDIHSSFPKQHKFKKET